MSILRKAVDVLQIVAARNGITVRELAAVLGVPKSSSHRLIVSLVEVGMIQRAPNGEGYVLGSLIGELVGGQLRDERLARLAQPYLDMLRDCCCETVGLHVLRGDRRVLLAQAESREEHRWVHSNPGIPMPLHAGAASKAMLSLLSAERVADILGRRGFVVFTLNTPNDAERLGSELTRIRAQGYAISLQEVTPGIASIAVPVIFPGDDGAGDMPVAAVNVTGPRVRLGEAELKAVLPRLRATAAEIASAFDGGTLGSERSAAGA